MSSWRLELPGWGGGEGGRNLSQIPGFPAQDPPSRHQEQRGEDTKERLVERMREVLGTSEALRKRREEPLTQNIKLSGPWMIQTKSAHIGNKI